MSDASRRKIGHPRQGPDEEKAVKLLVYVDKRWSKYIRIHLQMSMRVVQEKGSALQAIADSVENSLKVGESLLIS
jgi:hypothetical protein